MVHTSHKNPWDTPKNTQKEHLNSWIKRADQWSLHSNSTLTRLPEKEEKGGGGSKGGKHLLNAYCLLIVLRLLNQCVLQPNQYGSLLLRGLYEYKKLKTYGIQILNGSLWVIISSTKGSNNGVSIPSSSTHIEYLLDRSLKIVACN